MRDDFKAEFEQALMRIGSQVTVVDRDGGSAVLWAAVQPITSQNKKYLEAQVSAFGEFERSYAVYYGPCTEDGQRVQSGATVIDAGVEYTVRRSEIYRVCGSDIYIWAILVRGAADGQDFRD